MAKPVLAAPVQRPRKEPGSTVSCWVRQREHDQLIRMAQDRRMTVSRLMRTLLVVRLR